MAGAVTDEETGTVNDPEHLSFALDFALLFVVTLILAVLVGGLSL